MIGMSFLRRDYSSCGVYGGDRNTNDDGKAQPQVLLGVSAVSVISASANLDSLCMRCAQGVRIQSKTEIIDSSLLTGRTKSLLIQFYYAHKNTMPQRILV